MKALKKYICFGLLLFLAASCAKREVLKDRKGKVETDKDITAQVDADIDDLYAWVNLMPGPNFKPKFNITGKIEVKDSRLYDFKKLKMVQINVYQNGNRVFEFAPKVQVSAEKSSDKSIYLMFSTLEGQTYSDKEFNPNKSIEVKLLFAEDGKLFSHMIYNIKVAKAV